MNEKNIFQSKTFWVNVLMIAASMGDVLPPEYAAQIVAVANLILRILTNQPINILPRK